MQRGLMFAFVAQGVEIFGVGDAFQVEPECFEGGLLLLVEGDHLLGEMGEEIVDGVVAVGSEFGGGPGEERGGVALFVVGFGSVD